MSDGKPTVVVAQMDADATEEERAAFDRATAAIERLWVFLCADDYYFVHDGEQRMLHHGRMMEAAIVLMANLISQHPTPPVMLLAATERLVAEMQKLIPRLRAMEGARDLTEASKVQGSA